MTEQQNTRPSASREEIAMAIGFASRNKFDASKDAAEFWEYLSSDGRRWYLRMADAVLEIQPTPGNTDPIAKYDDELRKVQGGWRDMESAPRDGTAILAFGHAGTAQSIWFAEQTGQWHTTWHGMESIFRNPTHWMPLPPAPTEHPTEQPSVKVAENGEVCKSPIRSENHNGEEVVSFDERHTLADIARWISENPVDRDEMVHLLTGGQMKQPSVRDAARVLLDYLPNYAMENAALESRARDDEGEFASLSDLLDFSGQNKAYTVVREALAAALRSLAQEDGA